MPGLKWSPTTKYAISGRVVTLNGDSDIYENGIVYIEGDTISDVRKVHESAPPGWRKSDAIRSGGTLYPGMIELHNHLAYNIVPMWDVPRTFPHRGIWRSHPDYKKKMTGPLRILGKTKGYLEAIVRYTECKLLFSGVTSSQGITLGCMTICSYAANRAKSSIIVQALLLLRHLRFAIALAPFMDHF